MSTAVAEKKKTELSSDLFDDMFEMSGAGTDFDQSEMVMPFIRIAQQMSPQVNKNKPEYIKGLQASDIFNTVTGEYWDGSEGLRIVACSVVTKYTAWIPLEQGGGFAGELAPTDPMIRRAVREGNKEILPDGNELVKADHWYVLYQSKDGSWNPAVLDMKITQLKVSRRWRTQAKLLTVSKDGQSRPAPIFAGVWKVTTVEETNRNDQSYSNYSIELDERVSDRELFEQAKAFFMSISAGEVKAAAPEEKTTSVEQDDSIPF